MSTDFDGPDLYAGEIRAVRTFDLRSDGTLWPVFAADRAWAPGPNESRCPVHRPAGAAGCKCGYWAYGSPEALRDQFAARNVAAVVSMWGRATPGTRGLRAQWARIEAVWLSHRVQPDLRSAVATAYPGVPIYDDRAAMLAAHPITVLPSYRLPARPRWQTRIAGWLARALLLTVLVLGVLPRTALEVTWVAVLRGEVLRVLAFTALAAVVMWGFERRVQRRMRSVSAGLIAVVAVLGAWVWAPFVPLLWQVPLRAPLLFGLLPFVLSRLVRFVPTPARPGPGT